MENAGVPSVATAIPPALCVTPGTVERPANRAVPIAAGTPIAAERGEDRRVAP